MHINEFAIKQCLLAGIGYYIGILSTLDLNNGSNTLQFALLWCTNSLADKSFLLLVGARNATYYNVEYEYRRVGVWVGWGGGRRGMFYWWEIK